MQPEVDLHDTQACQCLYCQLMRVIDARYTTELDGGGREIQIKADEALPDLASIIIEILSTCPDQDLRRALTERTVRFISENVREPPSGLAGKMLH